MKKFELSQAAPLALSLLLSFSLSIAVMDAIAAQGGEAVAALTSAQPEPQPLLTRSNPHVAPLTT
jgi:hypothetical protein